MTSEIYLAYLAVVAVFFATPPGPSQLLMLSNSARHGAQRSLWTAFGDLTANALQMTAAGFGLAVIIAASDIALDVVKWAGVAYLVWMGVRTFRSTGSGPATAAASPSARTLWLQGFVTSASNPKAVVFFAALFPQFISPDAAIWPQILILGATYLVIDGAILFLYGLAAERAFARFTTTPRRLNRSSGSLMIGAAGLLSLKDLDTQGAR